MTDKLIAIGKIVAPHGVRGDVRVIPLTDFPERFRNTENILLEDGTTLTIEGVKYHKQFVLLKFRGFDDMNSLEPLRGKTLNVSHDNLMPLPEGHYYIFDIIGLKVYSDSGEYLGVINDVLQTGSNDVYVTERPETKQPLLIPALKDVVKKIDIAGKQMIVKLQEEWE